METLIIHGCGGHARSAAVSVMPKWNVVFVDKNARPDEEIIGCPVFRNLEMIPAFGKAFHHIGSGDLNLKKNLFDKYSQQGFRFPVLIAPDAVIAKGADLEPGVFIGAGAYIGPLAHIGKNSIINTHAVVEHDVCIGCHSHISIHASVAGYTRIGSQVMLGAGATVIDKMNISDNVIIGAGAVVVHNISISGTYVGVPAHRIK